jgi:hypothetical protein
MEDEALTARRVPIFFSFEFKVLKPSGGIAREFEALLWGVTEASCTGGVRSSGGSSEALFHRARLDRRRKEMAQTSLLEELSARISEFLAASPAKDLEKNLRALLTAAFARLDLATREEFEVQARVLARAREKLAELERRVVELEARLGQK